MKKNKEHVEEVFVRAVVQEGQQYAGSEYLSEMLNVGVTERQLPRAALEFALDNICHLYSRLNTSEVKEVEKRLKKYFKDII